MTEEAENGKPRRTRAPQKVSRLDKLIGEAIGQERPLGADNDPARDKWPTLWEWMSQTAAGQFHVKMPARLSVTLGPDGVIIQLSDSDLACALNTSCPHLENVFQAIEDAFALPSPPIVSFGKKQPNLRKRKMNS